MKKFSRRMVGEEVGGRFATPENVAEYRARRLSCRVLLEIGCGIGGQTIAFARHCKKVIAVDIDPKMVRFAKLNCKRRGIKNVEFFVADGTDEEFVNRVMHRNRIGIEYVFCDPSRPPSEDERSVSSMSPSPQEILSAYHWVKGIAIEAPPQLTPERIPFECEKEYISLDGQLNRLTLYFGEVVMCESSGVMINDEVKRVEGSPTDPDSWNYVDTLEKFAYEPDPAVVQSRLLPPKFSIYRIDRKRILITSPHPLESPYFKNSYEVVDFVRGSEMNELIRKVNEILIKEGAGKAVLRGNVNPKDYWNIRNRIEHGLKNGETFHVFIKGDSAIVMRVLD